jgi:hypothetical protein
MCAVALLPPGADALQIYCPTKDTAAGGPLAALPGFYVGREWTTVAHLGQSMDAIEAGMAKGAGTGSTYCCGRSPWIITDGETTWNTGDTATSLP